MSEIRYGMPGLYLVAAVGRNPVDRPCAVWDNQASALTSATELCDKRDSYVVYELREVARVELPSPVVTRS